MALLVYWYDFICFGIVVGAFIGSLWVLWMKEAATKCEEDTIYESLLMSRPDNDGFVRATPRAHVGSSQLWTSCWKGVHPGWLLVTRFVSLVVMTLFLTWDVMKWNASVFIYYTEWTFTLVIIYFALGTIISAYGCWVTATRPPSENGARDESVQLDVEDVRNTNSAAYRAKETKNYIKLQSHYAMEEFHHRAGFFGYVFQAIYQACGGAVVLTDIVFWCVIVPFLSDAHLTLNLMMGCMHSLNAVFLLIDTFLGSLPFPWFRIAYFVQFSCIYVVFQWIIHACGFTWWPYPFLELDTAWAPLWYFCLAVLHVPCYGIYLLIVKAKNSILPRLFPHAFVRSY